MNNYIFIFLGKHGILGGWSVGWINFILQMETNVLKHSFLAVKILLALFNIHRYIHILLAAKHEMTLSKS